MRGQIIEINSDLHYVKSDNEIYPCKCRGIFRHEHIIPVVGDYVLFDEEKNIINEILERKNLFDRPKVSNIDQAFIVTSLVQPNYSDNLLDKFIVLMEINKVKPIIVLSKSDLVNDMSVFNKIFDYYKSIGYDVVFNYELDKIKKLLNDKVSVFVGQSGAGKSTLLNKLNPEFNIKTNEISLSLGRGKHTTRVTKMYELFGGRVVDTPGFSALSIINYSKEEIRSGFIEFKKFDCEYRDCFHINEKICGVKDAVISNNIMRSRYDNYLRFIGDDNNGS